MYVFHCDLNTGVAARQTASHKNARRIAHISHARNQTEPALDLAIQFLRLLIAILVLLEIDSNEKQVTRVKPWIDALKVHQRSHQKASSRQHEYGEHHLRNHKRAA